MRASWRRELVGMTADDTKQHDLSWLDYTYPADISPDGKTLLFDEEGGGGSLDTPSPGACPTRSTFARPTALPQSCWAKAAPYLYLPTASG